MSDPSPDTPPQRFSQTRTARLARRRLERLLEGDGNDLALWRRIQSRVPEAWATLEDDIDCTEPKVKISLRLDASVAKFYRAMGEGYQARVNRILATYAQMKIGEVERERRLEDEVDAALRAEVPEELAEAYRLHREDLAAEAGVDVEWLDRFFGVG